MKNKNKLIGIDLFAGAGGMSLGAQMAGIEITHAVENNPHAASTYAFNHPGTKVIIDNIENIRTFNTPKDDFSTILFGGPPCQGFSTSNQKTRNSINPQNWLFKEFIRIAKNWKPDWVLFENVRGIIETEKGLFKEFIIKEFENIGYTCSQFILCASDYGVPQVRSRFFLIGSRNGTIVNVPINAINKPVTVRQAIFDLPSLTNGAAEDYLTYPRKAQSNYAKEMRNGSTGCKGHLVSNNAAHVIKRYRHIPQGGNWANIPNRLMKNYKDCSRCHTGIYRRLHAEHPSVVIGNFRKNMLIHPTEDRGLSIREAARLQSFPDWYEFQGSIGFQQQQVGNAVPPLLAKAVFDQILKVC